MRLPAASLLLLAGFLLGCWKIFPDPSDRPGTFLAEPVNLTAFNSEFDDYNSALPQNRSDLQPLVFSSKRVRKDKFNLVFKFLNLSYNDNQKRLDANETIYGGWTDVENARTLENQVTYINGDFNVLGPQVLSFGSDLGGGGTQEWLTLYADDRDGDLNVRFFHNRGDKWKQQGPFEVRFLNGPADDAYPSFREQYGKPVSELYFTSNRGGNFDIYRVKLPTNKPFLETLLTTERLPVEKVEELSTPADDKCPNLLGDVMVFTSNRPGGQGGFDLYVSRYQNGTWSKPENLGTRINTASDEYRPALVRNLRNFTYDLMIFSSNRPGGKGGFDLYMVGLPGAPAQSN